MMDGVSHYLQFMNNQNVNLAQNAPIIPEPQSCPEFKQEIQLFDRYCLVQPARNGIESLALDLNNKAS